MFNINKLTLITILNIFIIISTVDTTTLKEENSDFFKHYDYTQIFNIFQKLSQTCSHYIQIDTSQSRYNLNNNINKCGNNNCQNLIVFLTDFDSYTLDRPVFYISGLLHGDEILGPTSITEFSLYFCETYQNQKNSIFHNILKNKLIIMTPMTNAYGYYNLKREDIVYYSKNNTYNHVDPNRDFPYFIYKKNANMSCMKTLTARTINEIFNEYIIEGGITFHGGDSIIGYNWGNFLHFTKKNNKFYSTEAPDNLVFEKIGKIMLQVSKSDENIKNKIKDYKLGDMTSLVYAVEGGLEDWSYGGSWENKINEKIGINKFPIVDCTPETFEKYDMSWKNIYNLDINYDYKLRCVMYLIEAYDVKMPNENLYGKKYEKGNIIEIFDFQNVNNFYGLIPRNMRMMYSAIDLISASIFINVEKIIKNDNYFLIPFIFMGCLKLKKYSVYKIQINNITREILDIEYLKKFAKNKNNLLYEFTHNINCYYSNYDFYNLTIDINNNLKNINYLIFIEGEGPDQDWGKQTNPDPNVPPQTHVVRSKLNSNYSIFNGNYTLGSNYYFYSYPMILINNQLKIIDDIDTFLYQENDNDFYLILHNKPKYETKTNILLNKNLEKGKYLISETNFNVDLSIQIINYKIVKLFEKTENSQIQLKAKFSLNSNESYITEDINCGYEIKNENNLIIKCPDLIKKFISDKNITITGKYLRNNLPNSIFGLKIIINNSTLYNILGQISLKNKSKTKYCMDTFKGNKFFCASNFFKFFNFAKNIYNYTNSTSSLDIYYSVNITKLTNKLLNLEMIIKISDPIKYTNFIILFPFSNRIELIYINNTIKDYKYNFRVELNDQANGKIIGKTIYLIPINLNGNDDLKKIIYNISFIDNNIDLFLNKIKNIVNTIQYIPCSIMASNSYSDQKLIDAIQKVIFGFDLNEIDLKDNFKIKIFFILSVLALATALIILIITIIKTKINNKNKFIPLQNIEIPEITDNTI